jgi:excisionase family DNA binding protein
MGPKRSSERLERSPQGNGTGLPPSADVPLGSSGCLYINVTTTPAPTTTSPTGGRPRPLLVNIMEAAEILALSRSSIYQLIWNEQLVPIRIGRSVRLSIEQLEQFVSDRQSA